MTSRCRRDGQAAARQGPDLEPGTRVAITASSGIWDLEASQPAVAVASLSELRDRLHTGIADMGTVQVWTGFPGCVLDLVAADLPAGWRKTRAARPCRPQAVKGSPGSKVVRMAGTLLICNLHVAESCRAGPWRAAPTGPRMDA